MPLTLLDLEERRGVDLCVLGVGGPLDGDAAPCRGPKRVEHLVGDQPAFPHDGHPVAEALHLAERVAGEEDGVPLGCHPLQLSDELVLHERIERGRRLIQDQQPRPVGQGQDEPELLAHAPGHLAGRHLEIEHELLRQRRARPQHVAAAGGAADPQVVFARHRRVETEVAGEVSDIGLDAVAVTPAVEPEHPGPTAGGAQEAQQHADGRRLSGAVGSEETEQRALGDAQVDLLDADPPPVAPR